MCRCTNAMTHMWRSENNLQELTLPFHHAGPGDWPQAVSLVANALTDWAHLTNHLSKQFWKSGKHVAVKQSNISWYPCIIKFVPHTNKNRLFGSGWGSHTYSTSIWESKTRRPTVRGQPRLFSKTPISKIRNRITERGKTAFGQQRVMKTSSAGPLETLVLVWGLSKGTVLPEAR